MFNIPPIKNTEAIKAEILPKLVKTWKVGQILYGRAEAGATANSQVVLRIGEQRLQAQAPIDLKAGDNLKLLVKELGEPPLLSIQGTANKNPLAVEQLKLFIAQQTDMQTTLKRLKSLQNNPQLPASLRQSLNKLLQQLPDIQQATQAPALKNLLKNNAIFLESQLLKNVGGTLQNNFKALLNKLQEALFDYAPHLTSNKLNQKSIVSIENLFKQFANNAINIKQLIDSIITNLPSAQLNNIFHAIIQNEVHKLPNEFQQIIKQLLNFIQQQNKPQNLVNHLNQQLQHQAVLQELSMSLDSLLNKITTQQLIPLSRDLDNSLLLIFSLLFKDNKDFYPIDFKIEESPSKAKSGKKDWLINIKFEFSSMGIIQARVHILDNQVSTFFQAEKLSTVSIIQQQLPLLEDALQQAGFNIMQFNIEQHKIKQQPDYPSGIHILDEDV